MAEQVTWFGRARYFLRRFVAHGRVRNLPAVVVRQVSVAVHSADDSAVLRHVLSAQAELVRLRHSEDAAAD